MEEVEKEVREDREIDNVELDDLTDSDDELWLICFVRLNASLTLWRISLLM